MSYRSLLHALRLPAISADDNWQPPSPDTRYTLPEGPMECVYVAITNHDEFYRLLAIHARAGRIVGPVLTCRLYQRRANRSPEYDVWFLAVMPLKHGRNELRVRCGSQDLDQHTEEHPASKQAARLHEELATHCALLGVQLREASYEEMA